MSTISTCFPVWLVLCLFECVLLLSLSLAACMPTLTQLVSFLCVRVRLRVYVCACVCVCGGGGGGGQC